MAYTYQYLTDEQVRLLNDYSPWSSKINLAQIMDECVKGAVAGIINASLTVGTDANIAQDLIVSRRLYVGGGYGTTGFTVDEFGSLMADGSADFTISGVKTIKKTPATSGAPGAKGTIAYDSGFIYICIADSSWKRIAISAGW